MILHTPLYLLFLLVTASCYWLLSQPAWRKWLLLAASYVFYASFDLRFALLLFGLTVGVYLLGLAMAGSARPRLYAWISIGLSLGVLGVFKYANFFLSSALAPLNLTASGQAPAGLHLLLPIGLSFYTFQAIAYTLALYQKKLEPVPGFLDVALSLAFFPKLIAGPLVQPADFFRQLAQPPQPPTRESAQAALGLLALGLFKKIVIADSLASLSAVAFRAAALPAGDLHFPAPLFWQGFYLYAFQIYADFSGYTDIARASAMWFGFVLPENFQQPYLAATIGAFWNRWHISLTRWFREHWFFPFSRWLLIVTRQRYTRLAQVTANFVTMSLIGLWHGADWTFIAWGLWHGALLSLDRLLDRKEPPHFWKMLLSGLVTFHLVGIGWVFFGAGSFATAARFLGGMVSLEQWVWLPFYFPPVLLTAGLVLGIDLAASRPWPIPARGWIAWRPVFVLAALIAVISLMMMREAAGNELRPFLYGRF